MTVRTISDVVNTDTFGQWKQKTNDTIAALKQAATLGGPSANNDAELYISADIKTSGTLFTDTIRPLNSADNTIFLGTPATAPLTRMYDAEIFVSPEGKQNALQFRYGDLTSEESWSIGPGLQHDSLRFTGYFAGGVGVDPITSYLEIYRADSIDEAANNAVIPGLITATNLVIDDNILPAQARFTNAETASRFQNIRTITFSDQFNGDDADQATIVPIGDRGDVSGFFKLDGSSDLTVFLKVRDDSHAHDARYYTIAQIDSKFTTTEAGLDAYVLTSPPLIEGELGDDWFDFDISDITRGGLSFADDSQLILGTGYAADNGENAVFMSYNGIAQAHVVRQKYGDSIHSVANKIIYKKVEVSGQDTPKFEFDLTTGNFVANGDVTAFGSTSDIRLKENLSTIDNALDKVGQLNGITFNYIDRPNERMTGLVAQELQAVLPEAVYEVPVPEKEDETHLAIRYGNVVGLLVEAIKELKKEIDDLKAGR